MKFISNYTYKLVFFIVCMTIIHSCKTIKKSKESENKISLNKDCLSSLDLENYKISQEYILVVNQFISKNECRKEAVNFSKKAMAALQDGTIKKISLACLDKYFNMSQKSPFGINFGGVFSCEY